MAWMAEGAAGPQRLRNEYLEGGHSPSEDCTEGLPI